MKRAELVAGLAHAEKPVEYCRAGIAAIDAVYFLWNVEPPIYKVVQREAAVAMD